MYDCHSNKMRSSKGDITYKELANKWLSLIAIALLCFIATALQYHHHVGDKVCFLWTENHVSLQCCHNDIETHSHSHDSSEEDECGLHTLQIFVESQSDQDNFKADLCWNDIPVDIFGEFQIFADLKARVDICLQRIEIPDIIPLRGFDINKAIVRRGPPVGRA